MFYDKLVRPLLFQHDSEEIHDRVLSMLRRVGNTPVLSALVRSAHTVHDKRLEQKLFDLTFANPVGLAAGMDKAGLALRGFESLGFGFLEMGGITAMKQDGNPKPRIFRLPEDEALINRMGFNNPGAEEVAYRLGRARRPGVPLGINIGKSKIVPVDDLEAVVADYCYTFLKLYDYGDFFVINPSSPNTPGLRSLQKREALKALLEGIQRQNLKAPRRPHERPKPILVKIAPDLTVEEIDDILTVINEVGIDGIVATNTTTSRDGLKTNGEVAKEVGGLSGKPLRRQSLEIVKHIHKQFPSLPIIGVGGIFSAEDAWDKIAAGASLVQVYTGFIYEGPGLPRRINKGLLKFMECDGVKSIGDLNISVNRS
ncbi:MAG: quinone-dependent dihydroorotate dehydrogenase [Candidatus Taylorbacteria bacterium]|nr:quinone-dependent dihydroorotate dehydrogenase [Candidatus Taylorbacteria bacterium]